MPLLVVYVLVRIYWFVYEAGGALIDALWEQAATQVILWVLPCVVITMQWRSVSAAGAWRTLGLGRGVGAGLAFGLVTTVPMAIAAFMENDGDAPGLQRLSADCVLGPLAESVLFSGFLLTHLMQRTHWPAIAALIACGLMFGFAHQTDADMWLIEGLIRLVVVGKTDALVQFASLVVPRIIAIGAGGLLFSWIFYRWGSLWPAIGLHAAMNLWWAVSAPRFLNRPEWLWSATAIAQGVSVAIAVAVTAYWTRRRALQSQVT